MVRLGHGGVLGPAEMVFRFYDADSAECSGEGGEVLGQAGVAEA